jgi:hypothetical protein
MIFDKMHFYSREKDCGASQLVLALKLPHPAGWIRDHGSSNPPDRGKINPDYTL